MITRPDASQPSSPIGHHAPGDIFNLYTVNPNGSDRSQLTTNGNSFHPLGSPMESSTTCSRVEEQRTPRLLPSCGCCATAKTRS
jgi:hypothetical protein